MSCEKNPSEIQARASVESIGFSPWGDADYKIFIYMSGFVISMYQINAPAIVYKPL